MKKFLSIILASLVCLCMVGCSKKENHIYMFNSDNDDLNIHFILPEKIDLWEVSGTCHIYLLRKGFHDGRQPYEKSVDNGACHVSFKIFSNVSTIYSEAPIDYVDIEVQAYNEYGDKLNPNDIEFYRCRDYVDGLINGLNADIGLQLRHNNINTKE